MQGGQYPQGQYPQAPYPPGAWQPGPPKPRLRKGEFIGVGCFVQGIGLLLPYLFYVALGVAGALVGIIVCLGLLVLGGRMSTKWLCGACKNPIANGSVEICPTCRSGLYSP
jgi:hypothetical protein